MKYQRIFNVLSVLILALSALSVVPVGTATAGANLPHVLQVGTWNGVKGKFTTIQSAVDAASPGDWILIAPGDYRETGSTTDGVRITSTSMKRAG